MILIIVEAPTVLHNELCELSKSCGTSSANPFLGAGPHDEGWSYSHPEVDRT